jgi:hypothetical protein
VKPTPRALLLHPVCLTSVILLLVNDHYWKYEYHNVVTGKLSDITGLIVFPLFLSALFPKYRLHSFIFSALVFIWWKSPWATPAINWMNANTGWSVGRVIDPTDLLALFVLPLAWRIKAREHVSYRLPLFRNLAITLSAVFTLTGLCATTCIRHLQTDEPIYTSGDFRTHAYDTDVIGAFGEHNIAIRRDTVDFRKLGNDNLYTPVKDSSGTTYMAPTRDIYMRSVPQLPTFTIPQLILGNDTVHEVRFHIEVNNRKFRRVRLQSFRYYAAKKPRDYTRFEQYIEKQFRKPILDKLKTVLQ